MLLYDRFEAKQAPKILRLWALRDRLAADAGAVTTDEIVTLIDLLSDVLGSLPTTEMRERQEAIARAEESAEMGP